jgi:hypothetical protein
LAVIAKVKDGETVAILFAVLRCIIYSYQTVSSHLLETVQTLFFLVPSSPLTVFAPFFLLFFTVVGFSLLGCRQPFCLTK